MSNNRQVDEFMEKLDHPLKPEMEAIRAIILKADSRMEEDVKWGGPSFDYKEPMATFNPRLKDCVALIFHKGELLNDQSGLLEKGTKGKAFVKIRTMAEVKKAQPVLEGLVQEWIRIMES
ncbi:DUF1801 domain-containing protein [Pedobacter heparinus]|uniref:DUF1801 domain-containing protein n=1 Tax=Pedobacter heparinus TaxID=984 RepID=UPI00292DB370|nr:DUF1801 domain-containing protein [Pedobacter heparinus]